MFRELFFKPGALKMTIQSIKSLIILATFNLFFSSLAYSKEVYLFTREGLPHQFGSWFGHSALIFVEDGSTMEQSGTVLQFGGVFFNQKSSEADIEAFFKGTKESKIRLQDFIDFQENETKLENAHKKQYKKYIDRLSMSAEEGNALYLKAIKEVRQRTYFYHTFKNNCTTKTRDLLVHFFSSDFSQEETQETFIGLSKEIINDTAKKSQNSSQSLTIESFMIDSIIAASINQILQDIAEEKNQPVLHYVPLSNFSDLDTNMQNILMIAEHFEKKELAALGKEYFYGEYTKKKLNRFERMFLPLKLREEILIREKSLKTQEAAPKEEPTTQM
jgi:hypothetical protein